MPGFSRKIERLQEGKVNSEDPSTGTKNCGQTGCKMFVSCVWFPKGSLWYRLPTK